MAEPGWPRDLRVVAEPLLRVWSVRVARKGGPGIDKLVAPVGLRPPASPNDFSGDETLACAWVEPRAWLVLGSKVPEVVASAPVHSMITDIADRVVALRISGSRARELLSAALSVVAPDVLKPGRCARTRFAEEVDVLVQQLGPADYRLLVDRSLAHYVASWLQDAAELLDDPGEVCVSDV